MLKLCRSRQWPDFVSWNSKRYFSCKFYDISLDDDDDISVKCDTWLDRTWAGGLRLVLFHLRVMYISHKSCNLSDVQKDG